MDTPSGNTGISRRKLLRSIGGGFGTVGLAQMLASTASAAPDGVFFSPRAKRVIFLFLNGGPSHVETFDYKPALAKYHGKPMPTENPKTERLTGNLLASPFSFRKFGQSGLEISELFSKLGEHADDTCIIRSMHTDRPFHDAGLFLMNCGYNLAGFPSMGSWITYGLGTENRNLPGFVVLCPGLPTVGTPLWSASFLPGMYQGTQVMSKETDPEKLIPNLRNSDTRFWNQVSRQWRLRSACSPRRLTHSTSGAKQRLRAPATARETSPGDA
jgi:hypothetical protein